MEQNRKKVMILVLAHLLLTWAVPLVGTQALAGSPQDFNAKIQRALHGDANDYCDLGMAYLTGEEVPRDYQQAHLWFRKAANYNNSNGQYHLGEMYEKGQGIRQDYNQALSWYRKADEQGHSKAGSRIRQIDADIAALTTAAKEGTAEAQLSLGELYAEGNGVPQSDEQAALWYRKAADQGNPMAQYQLALVYAAGKGVPQDDKQSVLWYQMAIAQDYAPAKYALSGMYFKGKGVARDKVYAYAWLTLAADQGDEMAITNKEFAAAMLTPEQLAKADALATELQAKIDKKLK
jgi:hypothetical protein